MRSFWLAGLAALSLAASAQAQPSKTPARAQPPVWRQLERFSGDAEFMRYVRDVQALSSRGRRGVDDEEVIVTGSAIPPPPPPPPADVFSTATPVAEIAANNVTSAPSSITNVQTQGVDEGGIVKQIGRFLIVLQDGRLFVVDTQPSGAAGLALVGRTNVYRNPRADTWYDELLVSGDRVLVTGYSYREQASEITIFSINAAGALTRETTYYISSNDYYDIENYSTRLVDGNLVIYTPLNLSNINTGAHMRWPLVRRWLRDGERQAVTTEGRPLFDGDDIYKPIQRTIAPVVHSVSICPLGAPRAGDELDCRTTAFVGASQREFFVSPSDIFLWVSTTWDDVRGEPDCPPRAALFQVPLSGATPRAIHTQGAPTNQLALDATTSEFRALLDWRNECADLDEDLRYFSVPLSQLSTTPTTAPARAYVPAPSPHARRYEVRFTGTHVVYGGRPRYSDFPPDESLARTTRLVALPVARPANAVVLEAPHDIIRIERARDNIVLTGYRTDLGLSVSLLQLGARPHIASTRVLEHRYEAENRSHAFNSLIGADGAGLMGLPTVTRVKDSDRSWSRSEASDVSFLAVDAAGRLDPLGALVAGSNAQHSAYACEVSCIDWYGNSRALFMGGRVFALSATEMIEGAVAGGRIAEIRRLNLSAPPPRAR